MDMNQSRLAEGKKSEEEAAAAAAAAVNEMEATIEEGGKIEYVSYGGEEHLPLIMNLVDQELSEPYSIFTYRYFVYLWPQLSFLAFHEGKCVGTVVCKMGDHRNTLRGYIAMLVVLKPYRGRGIATELVSRSIAVMMQSGCEEERSEEWQSSSKNSIPSSKPLSQQNAYPVFCNYWILEACDDVPFFYFVLKPSCFSYSSMHVRCPTLLLLPENVQVTLEAEVTNKGALALYGRLGFIRSKRLFRYYLNGVDAFRLKLLFPRPEPYSSQSMIPTNAQIQRHNSEKQNVEDSLEHCL
ncbi:hypothetical protein M9H77_37046 [Catharanthus roseus]|uniref:Uncharacterized protein n=1 Tax=Catharanthus roseus TaxID=4058 RepID=A0ACB9ZW52_CATRO|nr:hypothetical protein M9H77_37046 [Catharanthus roseus]